MENRASGILCHITSLPSPFGIGDFGPGAYAFADFLAETKQSYWQVLPLNSTNPAKASSPFSSLSAFAGNVLLISPQLLVEEGFLSHVDIRSCPSDNQVAVNYPQVSLFKYEVLRKAYQAFKKPATKRYEYDLFCKENSKWLDDYAMYAALNQRYEGRQLSKWPELVKNRNPQELTRMREELKEGIDQEKFVQYIFFRQWFRLKSYCNDKGIQIIGDFPFFMDFNSADVWTHPQNFKLELEAGVPGDSFSKDGQLFDCTVYNWEAMKENRYGWWIARLKQMFRMYDVLRIDHFRGFVACWEVPAGEPAVDGRWQPAAYYDFMNTLLKHVPSLPIFAEDLGVITADVREAMQTFNIPGIKILLGAFSRDMRYEAFMPHNHITNSVVYTSTHDSNTCQGWYEEKDNPDDKELFFKYLGRKTHDEVSWEFVRLVLMSVAKTAIIPLQDILGLGKEARMNTPGKKGVNWQWRFKSEQITRQMKARLTEMTVVYGRA
jgi:4-alpha-glucanotransferase